MKSMAGFGGGVASLIMKTAGGGDGIVTDNLVLHLDAGDSSSYSGSGTAWNDLSGQNNHATLVNSPQYSSNNDGYLWFRDGTNDHATLPAIDLTGNEITFAIWTYNINNTTASLIFLGNTGAPHASGRILNIHSLPYSGNMYYFDKGYDGSSSAPSYDRLSGSFSSTSYHTGWTHWAFTSNASTGSMKMYRNGSLFDSSTGNTRTLTNANGDIRRIARTNGSQCVNAYISNLQLYKKELSASEVTQNFNAMASRFGLGQIVTDNLVLHLDAGNSSSYSGSGTTWTDLTGNGNNGTLINGVSYSGSDGGYLDFDGSASRVDFSTYVQPAYTSSSSFTWFIWIYSFETNNNDVIMGNRNISGSNVWTKLTPKRFEWKYPDHMNEDGTGTNVTTNQWQNICITKNGSSFTYYKNGSSAETMTSTHSKNYTNPFYLAGDPTYGENTQCRISIVAVYDAALTASEVQQNFDATKGRYGL